MALSMISDQILTAPTDATDSRVRAFLPDPGLRRQQVSFAAWASGRDIAVLPMTASFEEVGRQMIFTKERDPRLVTVRRGGSLQDADHQRLAVWAADCARHVLHFFERAQPGDDRPRRAIELTHAWVRGEVTMTQAREAAFAANAAARDLSGAAREAAHAAGQAAAVAHVAAHELGAAAYAIRTVRAAAGPSERDEAGRVECQWQRAQLPDEIRELVLDDQRLRNEVCWSLFDC
jgi:Imm-5 like putative immunity protein